MEPPDRPDRLARGVRVTGGRGDAAGARNLHRRRDNGTGLSAVDVHDDVGVRDVDGVDVRHRPGHRLLAVHPHAFPRGTAGGPRCRTGRRRRDGHLRSGGRAFRPHGDRLGDRHLPDPDTGPGLDGHRRDSGGRRCGADLDDADARRPRVRSERRRPSDRRICTGRGARKPPSRGSGRAGRAR